MKHLNQTLFSKSQQGMSIIELLIAITISLILLVGVLQIFSSSKQSYKIQEGLSRVQENARFSFDIVSQDIRMVGYSGCGSINNGTSSLKISNIVDPPDPAITFGQDDAISGLNDIATTTYGGITAIAGTDVIIARSASPQSANLAGKLDIVNANIQLDDNSLGLEKDDVLFITDCENADIFRATSVSNAAGKITIAHANNGNSSNNLSKLYDKDALILSYQSHTYFIGDTTRTDTAGNVITALYRQNVNGQSEELIEGVEDMQITYGVNTDKDAKKSADAYMTADAIGATQWRDVVSARISFLLNTIHNVNPGNQAYTFQGVNTTPAITDRRLRRSYTTTIALRNRAG